MLPQTRLKDLREDRDIKQRELAAYLNVSRSAYKNYENGDRGIPVEVLVKLADYYKVSVDYLLRLTNNPKRNL